MDDAAFPSSPIIRSSWKPKVTAAAMASLAIPSCESPVTSFLSVNTVSPLTGLRESATVTDISWKTAFETPTKGNTSKCEAVNNSEDVFGVTNSEVIQQHSEMDISIKSVEDESSSGPETPFCDQSRSDTVLSKPNKLLSASEILSNFRSGASFLYPRAPPAKDGARNAAFYSTPKADRALLALPEPPESAIVASGRIQASMRLRICPCGTCSCPAVYLKDAGVQTVENGNETGSDKDNIPATSSLTQLAFREIGKFDGFTQQSILQETAKASRVRPKSVVTFSEPVDNIAVPDNKVSKSLTSSTTFKKAGSGAVVPRKPVDARKLFGEDLVALQTSLSDESQLGTDISRDPEPVIHKTITKSEQPAEAESEFAGSFKKAGSRAPILSSNKGFDARKLFGEDLDGLYNDAPRKEAKTVNERQEHHAQSKENQSSEFSTFKKAGSGAVISCSKKAFDPRKFFEEDFTDPAFKHDSGSCNQLHLNSSLEEPANSTDKSSGQRHSNSKVLKSVAFKESSSKDVPDVLAKVRSIFGEEDFAAIVAEKPHSTSIGFKSSKQMSVDETAAESNKTDIISTTMATCADVSDVESAYDIDSDVDAVPDVDEDSLTGFVTPEDAFRHAVDSPSNPRLAELHAEQQRMISEKAAKSVSPSNRLHGIIWRTRFFASEQSLKSISHFKPNFSSPCRLHSSVLQLLTNPYANYRFPSQYSGGNVILHWQTTDGGLLVASSDGTVGVEELKTCLMTTPGVDQRLVPEGWVENHCHLIFWKLAKEVFAFQNEFSDPGDRFNAECVMQQLKYRYDREIDLCQRPCLRRIVEKDSNSKHMMILCVSKIVQSSDQHVSPLREADDQHSKDSSSFHGTTNSVSIELSDGWYAVSAQLDNPLQRMVNAGRISVGCKLVIAGAELNGLEEAVDPLHIPSSCHLRLSANSTRLAKHWWSAKLGFVSKQPTKLCVPIRSLFAGGGNANALKAIVARVYPLLYVEKKVSLSGATDCIYRLEADEASEAERMKAAQERKMEELMAKMADSQSPRPGGKRRKITAAELKELSTGEEIAAALRESFDPESVQQMLTETQCNALQQYMNCRSDRMVKKVQDAMRNAREEVGADGSVVRNVTPVLKLFIIGLSLLDRQSETGAILSIWRPPENAHELLQEGRVYNFHSVSVSRPPTANQALLNGTHHTTWQLLPLKSSVEDLFVGRSNTILSDLTNAIHNSKLLTATNREVDLVGIVLRSASTGAAPEQGGGRRLFFVDVEGDIGVIMGTSVSFMSFTSGDCSRSAAPAVFVATNLRLNTAATGFSNQISVAVPSLFAQDYSTFAYLPPSTTTVPLRLANSCRHLEITIKTALANRGSLAENGLRKLESALKLCPIIDEVPRSVSRMDLRNVSLCGETGPQRPGSSSSLASASKTPASTKLTGPELQKRKMERLDRYCATSSIDLPSPLPADSMSTRARSVLKRAFRPPLRSNSSVEDKTPNK